MNEKRTSKRNKIIHDQQNDLISFTVQKHISNMVEATLLDLSDGGMGIEYDSDLKPGDKIEIENCVHNLPSKNGIVVWTLSTQGKNRAGIRFLI